MESEFSYPMVHEKVLLTLNSISETIDNIIEWNKDVDSAEDYYATPGGMQLLATLNSMQTLCLIPSKTVCRL